MNDTKELVRLQKYLADCGVAARRKSEEIIAAGRVRVNGVVTTELGVKVSTSDRVEVDGAAVSPVTKQVYLLLNKPVGYLTTAQDDFGRPTVMDLVKDEVHSRVFPVGRLDMDTEGLLLLTNDGQVAHRLTHPSFEIEKTYIATLDVVPALPAVDRLRKGVLVDGKKTAPAKVDWIRDTILHITIREGRNRQVRKMIEAVGYNVEHLQRISMGRIVLGNVPLGRWRHLTRTELQYLKGL